MTATTSPNKTLSRTRDHQVGLPARRAAASVLDAVLQKRQPLDDVLGRYYAEAGPAVNLAQTAAQAGLDAVSKAIPEEYVPPFLKKMLESFRRNGAALEGAKKARLEAIDTRLSEITTRFSQNVLDATNAFELYIPSEDGLAGLPESARVAAREAAVAQKKEGYRFTLHAPSLIPLLTYLDDRAVRETYVAGIASKPSGEAA